MRYFFFCSPGHKPKPYFKCACNQFGFGLILKSKDQLSIYDNSDCSSTPVFSSTLFQKWLKTPFSQKPHAGLWNLREATVV